MQLRKEALAKRGVKTLDVLDVQAGAVDVSSVVVRTLKSKPDGIVLSLMGTDTVRIVQELQNRGFKNRGAIVEIGRKYPLSILLSAKIISFQKSF